MQNEAIKKYLIDGYNELAFTHSYIFGYNESGMVYGARVMDGKEILPYITCLDHASGKNGGTVSLKYKPNKAQISVIIQSAIEIRPICTVEFLENEFRSTKFNRGQIFENLVASTFLGKQVEAKNAKFTDCGDVIVDKIHYQVKYLKATFTDERTLKNFGK